MQATERKKEERKKSNADDDVTIHIQKGIWTS